MLTGRQQPHRGGGAKEGVCSILLPPHRCVKIAERKKTRWSKSILHSTEGSMALCDVIEGTDRSVGQVDDVHSRVTNQAEDSTARGLG